MGSALSSIDQDDYPAADAATQLNANWTLIPELVGWVVALFLAGAACACSARYFTLRHNDRALVRWTVGASTVLVIATSALSGAAIVMHGASQERSNDDISLIVTPDALNCIVTGLQGLVVQSFFALRVFRVLPRRVRWVTLPVFGALILGTFGGALSFSTIALINGGSSSEDRGAGPDTAEQLMDSAMVWLCFAAGADTLISTILCTRLFLLRKSTSGHAESRTELGSPSSPSPRLEESRTWLSQLIRISMGTASLTSLFACAAAITFALTYATTNLTLAFANCLSPLYALSLLYSLMAGHRLGEEVAVDSRAVQIVWALNDRGHRRDMTAQPHDGPIVVLKTERCAEKAASRLGESVNVLHVGALDTGYKRSPRAYEPTASFPDDGASL